MLNRPRSSQNIGAAARALANTGAGALWVVEPLGFDRAQAAKLAAGADDVLDSMRVVRTFSEAVGDCVEVVMTTGRPVPGALLPAEAAARLLAAPRPARGPRATTRSPPPSGPATTRTPSRCCRSPRT